jgi:hypothetical protein
MTTRARETVAITLYNLRAMYLIVFLMNGPMTGVCVCDQHPIRSTQTLLADNLWQTRRWWRCERIGVVFGLRERALLYFVVLSEISLSLSLSLSLYIYIYIYIDHITHPLTLQYCTRIREIIILRYIICYLLYKL